MQALAARADPAKAAARQKPNRQLMQTSDSFLGPLMTGKDMRPNRKQDPLGTAHTHRARNEWNPGLKRTWLLDVLIRKCMVSGHLF